MALEARKNGAAATDHTQEGPRGRRPEGARTGTTRELRIGVLLILFAHACDTLSTYIATPDLSREVGPAYVWLAGQGFSGWPVLLGLKLVGVAVGILLFYLYVATRRRYYPAAIGRTFHEFLHDAHSKGAIRNAEGRWLMPSPMLVAVWMSFTVSIGSAAYAYYLAVQNLLLTPILSQLTETLVPAVIFMVTAFVFWRTLYEDYRRVSRARN